MKQYAGKRINSLAQNFEAYLSVKDLIDTFFNVIYNVDTAEGVGLDIWGRIVAQSRFLKYEKDLEYFGFDEAEEYYTFGDDESVGGTFYDGVRTKADLELTDIQYRLLILMKAFANIAQTTVPNLNRILSFIFADRGVVYVEEIANTETGNGEKMDLGDVQGMEIRVVFDFPLSDYEKAVIESPVFPHPCGVKVSMQYNPIIDTFGFDGSDALPFGQGIFHTSKE